MASDKKISVFLIFVVVVGMTLTTVSSFLFYSAESKAITLEFRKDVDQRAASLYREVLFNFEAVRSLAILFKGRDSAKYTRFKTEAQSILIRHPSIHAVEWVPRILASDKDRYIEEIQIYLPDYQLTERSESGEMIATKEAEEYYPVYYIEPLAGNEKAVGFNLASNPTRRKSLERSASRAKPVVSEKITLVQDRDSKVAFLALHPVYKGSFDTGKHRQQNLKGFVIGVYRVNDIFQRSALSGSALGIDMDLVDETTSEPQTLINYQSRTGIVQHNSISYRKELPELWGRKWSIIAKPTIKYVSDRRSILPETIFIVGVVFTGLVALYIYIMVNRAALIQKVVIKKTCELNEANKELRILTRVDGLTGISNRRYMDEVLSKEWTRAIRNKSHIAFILLDVDFFKPYNDHYGHPQGDECLKSIAHRLNQLIHRPSDLLARYGGEEFALILAETENAMPVAKMCLRAIEDMQIPHKFSEVSDVVTISIGLCVCAPKKGSDPSMIITAADKVLYKAKYSGRNRIEVIELKDGDIDVEPTDFVI